MRRSVVAPLAMLLPLAACRFDFDPVVLPCEAPQQLSIPVPAGAGSGSGTAMTLRALAATATQAGYAVLTVDSAGDVHGFSFAFDGLELVPRTTAASVFSGATGTIGAVDTGGGVLAAIAYGQPYSTGTALVPLNAQLAPNGSPKMNAAWFTLDSAIAGTSSGALAFLGKQSTNEVAAQRVSPDGTPRSGSQPVKVIDGAEGISVATITAAGAGFLVTWDAATPSPPLPQAVHAVRAEVLDETLSVVMGPTTINDNALDDKLNDENPRAGYAAAADRALFAWSFKTTNGSNELWVSLRDGKLAELHAIQLSTHGTLPRVAAGKDDFLVAWTDTSTTSGIAAARVRFDGSVVPLVVAGNGGKALAWDLTTRAGQPALVWIESAATPGVWLDPLCN